eukprot:CAMPEP_0178427652 /NCGR_PEP_ID=MMETSP0689_2-20121128/29857_1 /TAXON_ID=160604 /ORGANISM="Amphidinium massartii, Strain CS-259" /LENGTH=410 /DNA_ID=CAMNT_0020049369 /DNA_START=86 /DNA_END=1315 /DNA_ORIENTATION=-
MRSVAAQSACLDQLDNLTVATLQGCVDEVSILAGSENSEDHLKSLRKATGAITQLQETCPSALDRTTIWGCNMCSTLAEKVLADGLLILRACLTTPRSADCDSVERMATQHAIHAWKLTEDRCRNTGAEAMVTKTLAALRGEFLDPLLAPLAAGEAKRESWPSIVAAIDKLQHFVKAFAWKEIHLHWLLDSLEAGRVVQTTWGDAAEWEAKFGAHDALSDAPLDAKASPTYVWSEKVGMRWEIMPKLLRELRERRGGGNLVVVEIGVFVAHLSHFMLKECDFIQLFGVDPYIGVDGTFPGNFSQSLDADVALYKATTVMEEYPDRAKLLSVTSTEAAAAFPDDSIDVLFVDGCHLYDCVVEDFNLWLPKLRRGVETLVAGHDFSPQWPGVVRAVHERRGKDAPVHLGTDW